MFEILLICLPTILIPVIFFFLLNTIRNSHKIDALFHTDGILFLSILTGSLALIVGLFHQKFIPANYNEPIPHQAYVTRGWPIAWLGEQGFGLLFIPISVLINISFVSIFTAASLGIIKFSRRLFHSLPSETLLNFLLVCIFTVFPYWGQFIFWIQWVASYVDSFFNHV
jgi:hypothetical protein